MIFQAWVTRHCGGRPSEAVRRLEATAGGSVDVNRVYRAMRKPTRFPIKFAQLVVAASDGACTLCELMDLDTIAAHFEYTDPALRRVGLRMRIMRLERRRRAINSQLERSQAAAEAVDADLADCRAQLAELGESPLTAAS